MARVAVLMAAGFEEGETVTIVDILRRAGLTCDTFGIGANPVIGMHGMRVLADKVFPSNIGDYDMVVLPGGRPGGENLRTDPDVIALVREFDGSGRWVAAMGRGDAPRDTPAAPGRSRLSARQHRPHGGTADAPGVRRLAAC